MFVKKRMGLGLLAVLAAMVAMAFSAAESFATEITPAATAITVSSTETRFLPNNAFAENGVVCTASTGKAKTPEVGTLKLNQNKTSIGTFSKGPGSVNFDFTEPPTFTGCKVENLSTGKEVAPAAVATNSTNGQWSLGVVQFQAAEEKNDIRAGLIGVPKAGAKITITGSTCVLTVSPNEASAVSGTWTNGTNSTTAPSTVKVDSQIPTGLGTGAPKEACEALGLKEVVSQEEATYSVRTSPESATPVLVNR